MKVVNNITAKQTYVKQLSPDLNLIKNLWSLVKMTLYEGSKQYNSKADLSEVIRSWTESDQKSVVTCQDEIIWK